MVQTVLIGLVAGLAAALLFLAPAGGSLLAFPLFALTAVPMAIAGLGWSALAAAIAAVAGAVLIVALLPGGELALSFVLLFGAPTVWLTRLAALSRESDQGTRQWYPLGRLLLHASLAVAIVLVVMGIATGYDPNALADNVTAALVEWLAESGTEPVPTAAEIAPMTHVYLSVMPAMAGVMLMAITVLDLALAALVARASGRLQRVRDKLASVELPVAIPAGALAAAILAFLPAPFGEIAQVFAGAFIAALAIVGLAVLHAITVGMGGRTPILVAAYLLVLLSGLPILLFALLGASESFLHLRARVAGRSSKPD